MKASPSDRLDRFARRLLPFALTVLLVLVSVVPLPVPEYGAVAPWVSIIAVYYWVIVRADLLPHAAAFAIGLIEDVVHGTPLGLTALLLLMVQSLMLAQRRLLLGRSFLVLWGVFALVAAGAAALRWLLMAALAGAMLDPRPAAFQALMTVALFPALSWLLLWVQVTFLRRV